jgi:hypothetical protein
MEDTENITYSILLLGENSPEDIKLGLFEKDPHICSLLKY